MAQLLVRKTANNGYHAGDVVTVMPDDFTGWGRKEQHGGNYYIVRVPDLTVLEAQEFIRPVFDEHGTLIVKRRFKLGLERLRMTERLALLEQSEAVVAKGTINNILQDRITGKVPIANGD